LQLRVNQAARIMVMIVDTRPRAMTLKRRIATALLAMCAAYYAFLMAISI